MWFLQGTNGLSDRQWLGCWWETYEANTRIAFGSIRVTHIENSLSHSTKTFTTENAEENHGGITQTSTCIIYLYAKSH